MGSDVSGKSGSGHERTLRSLCHVRRKPRAGGEVHTPQRDRTCLEQEETKPCSSFRAPTSISGKFFITRHPMDIPAGEDCFSKPQKCFTARALQKLVWCHCWLERKGEARMCCAKFAASGEAAAPFSEKHPKFSARTKDGSSKARLLKADTALESVRGISGQISEWR